MLIGLISQLLGAKKKEEEAKKRRVKSLGPVYVNALNVKKLRLGDREILVRAVHGAGDGYILVEDVYGNLVQVPTGKQGQEQTAGQTVGVTQGAGGAG